MAKILSHANFVLILAFCNNNIAMLFIILYNSSSIFNIILNISKIFNCIYLYLIISKIKNVNRVKFS